MTLCFDAARGRWYSPDLSGGNIAMLTEHGGDWPISGDRITKAKGMRHGMIAIVDWASMDDDDTGD